jgi:hypothetical protein
MIHCFVSSFVCIFARCCGSFLYSNTRGNIGQSIGKARAERPVVRARRNKYQYNAPRFPAQVVANLFHVQHAAF